MDGALRARCSRGDRHQATRPQAIWSFGAKDHWGIRIGPFGILPYRAWNGPSDGRIFVRDREYSGYLPRLIEWERRAGFPSFRAAPKAVVLSSYRDGSMPRILTPADV